MDIETEVTQGTPKVESTIVSAVIEVTEDLSKHKRADLHRAASLAGMAGYSRLSRKELEAVLRRELRRNVQFLSQPSPMVDFGYKPRIVQILETLGFEGKLKPTKREVLRQERKQANKAA